MGAGALAEACGSGRIELVPAYRVLAADGHAPRAGRAAGALGQRGGALEDVEFGIGAVLPRSARAVRNARRDVLGLRLLLVLLVHVARACTTLFGADHRPPRARAAEHRRGGREQ